MKYIYLLLVVLSVQFSVAQSKSGAELFWENLKKHCGKSYEGSLTNAPANDDFAGKKLVMHVRACDDKSIRIPFFVGDDKSRTWILSYEYDRIQLKHDHRHEDGTEDNITQYGGEATNPGSANFQMFPADSFTCAMIDYACNNIWWITLDDKSFTYNLRRVGSDRVFTVTFDLTKTVETPSAPWGWKD
jgi:hypothetical protein